MALAKLVKIMVAIEVPNAICIRRSVAKRFASENKTTSDGTNTKPPPMPSNPAIKPVNKPKIKKAGNKKKGKSTVNAEFF